MTVPPGRSRSAGTRCPAHAGTERGCRAAVRRGSSGRSLARTGVQAEPSVTTTGTVCGTVA